MVEYMHSDPCSHRTTDACKPKKSLLASSPFVILRFPFVLAKCQECNNINNTKINDKIFVHVFYKKTKFQNSAPFTSRNSYLFLLFYHIFRNLFKQDFTISWLIYFTPLWNNSPSQMYYTWEGDKISRISVPICPFVIYLFFLLITVTLITTAAAAIAAST